MGPVTFEVLSSGVGSSAFAPAVAVLATVPVRPGRGVTVSVALAVSPTPRVPKSRATMVWFCSPWVGVQPVDAEVNVTSVDSGSLISALGAIDGPWLTTSSR